MPVRVIWTSAFRWRRRLFKESPFAPPGAARSEARKPAVGMNKILPRYMNAISMPRLLRGPDRQSPWKDYGGGENGISSTSHSRVKITGSGGKTYMAGAFQTS